MNVLENLLIFFCPEFRPCGYQGWVFHGTSISEYGRIGLKYVYGECRTGNKGLKYVISTAKYSIRLKFVYAMSQAEA